VELLVSRTLHQVRVDGLVTTCWEGVTSDTDEPCRVYIALAYGLPAWEDELILDQPTIRTLVHGCTCYVWRGETTAQDECLVYVARVELGAACREDVWRCVPTVLELVQRRN
jgi:hypothetical protein